MGDLGKVPLSSRRLLIIHGEVYDATNFEHPGGQHMLDLGIGRDATIMFESMHVRSTLAATTLKQLPSFGSPEELEKLGYSFDRPAETWATPNQSVLYQTIRQRVVQEILKPIGKATGDSGARGVPAWHIASVLGGWLAAAVLFITWPTVASGALLGLTMCWVGLAIQHTANHGAMAKNPTLGYLLGLFNDVGPGGSSVVWRYHHQVSHHAYCNDVVLDQDAHSSFPLIRLDWSQKVEPHHAYQWLYGPVLFCFLAFSIHVQDLQCLFDAKTFMVRFKGTSAAELALGVALKAVHLSWLYVLPWSMHGFRAMLGPWLATICVGSFCLSALFIVSHNVLPCKRAEEPLLKNGDWAKYQIETTASWGGRVASFFTGGLNFQIEHHLFPAMPHNLHCDISTIVMEECEKAGVHYQYYPTLLQNFVDHVKFLYAAGRSCTESSLCEKLIQ